MDARRCLRRCLLEMFSLVMSAIWPRAAAAAGALHQCVHLCRFYRCAAASNFHHAYTGDRTQASTAWMPGDVCWGAFRPNPYSTIPLVMSAVWPRAAAAAGALHQCVHLCRFYRCAAACLMIQSRLVAGCSMIADSTAVMLLATDSTAVMLLADATAVMLLCPRRLVRVYRSQYIV
jgi:hypothetical protein